MKHQMATFATVGELIDALSELGVVTGAFVEVDGQRLQTVSVTGTPGIDQTVRLDVAERMDVTGNPRPLDNDRDPLNRRRCTRCGSPGCKCDALTGGAA